MCWFAEAFTVTIFGYSAPTSDQGALELLKKAWFEKSKREFEHIEIIDILCVDQIHKKWKNFSPTLHISSKNTFKESRLSRWPRRSCEALSYPMFEGLPCEDFPLPESDEIKDLQDYIKKISCFE